MLTSLSKVFRKLQNCFDWGCFTIILIIFKNLQDFAVSVSYRSLVHPGTKEFVNLTRSYKKSYKNVLQDQLLSPGTYTGFSLEYFQTLFTLKCPLDHEDKWGMTPYDVAVVYGHKDCATFLYQ